MVWILYFSVIAKFFLVEHACYVVYKDSDDHVQSMPSEFNIIKQIAKPIRQLADMLPNHNVEVQLEMLGAKNVPVPRPTRMSFIHYRKPPHNQIQVKRREYDPENQPTTPAVMTVHIHEPPPHQQFQQPHPPLQLQPLQFNQPLGYKEAMNMINRANYPPLGMYRRADTASQGRVGDAVYDVNKIPVQARSSGSALESQQSADSERKPVFMDDLKRALEDFERKILDKQNKINKDGPLEDAKKPLLKKDLWMALGLNHVAGCQLAHDHHLDPTTITTPVPLPIAVAVTPKIINLNSLGALDSNSFKIGRIMELLQGAIKANQPVTPKENNLHWLQVKIPKSQL